MTPKLRITSEMATRIVVDAGYTPNEPYPGGNKQPWSLRCDACGVVKPRTLQSVRDGRQCAGCRNQKHAEELHRHGYTPIVECPGVDTSWRMLHDACGEEGARSLSAIRRGSGCGCAAVTTPEQAEVEVREAGYTPEVRYPGRVDAEWPLRCNGCGTVRPRNLKGVREGGHRCNDCRHLSHDQAVAILADYGYTPLESYPGSKNARWSVRCDHCGWEKPRSLKRITKHGCRSCMGWLVRPEEVERRVRDAGFVPSVEYPGRKDRPWLCVCTGCGTEFPINISNVCRGHRSKAGL